MKKILFTTLVLGVGLSFGLLSGCSSLGKKSMAELRTEADENFRQGNYEKVIEYNTEILSREKDDGRAHIQRGAAYAQTDRIKDALSDYERAISLDPANVYPRLLRISLNLKENRVAAAEEELTPLIEKEGAGMEPHDRMVALVLQGEIALNKGDLHRALIQFKKAIALGNEDPRLWTETHYRDALYGASQIYYRLRLFDESYRYFKEYVAAKQRVGEEITGEDYYNLGILCYLREDFEKAHDYLKKAPVELRRKAAGVFKADRNFFLSSTW